MSLPATADALDALEDYEDLTAWIIYTFTPSGSDQSVESLTELDQQITQLIASLDIACEDTSSQLERTIDDVSRGVPRLTYDRHFIKDSALSLQSSLGVVHSWTMGCTNTNSLHKFGLVLKLALNELLRQWFSSGLKRCILILD